MFLRPPHGGYLVLLAGVLLGMLLEGGTIWATWRLCRLADHREYLKLDAKADTIQTLYEECLRRSCIFPRDRRP